MTMAQITTLKDRDGGGTLYPVTSTTAVFDPQGRDLETRLAAAPGNTVTKEEFDRGLAAKQGKLATTDDLRISDTDELSLTERAKQRLFDDMWKAAVGEWGDIDHGHTENRDPAPYMCNDIWMGYDEALLTLLLCTGWHMRVAGATARGRLGGGLKIRTPLPIYYSAGDGQMDFGGLAQSNGTIEAIRFVSGAPNNKTVSLSYAFYGCSRLRTISGTIYLDNRANTNNAFRHCRALETVAISYLAGNLSLQDSPLLSLESVSHMIANAANTSAITVTVHPDVYAKLTGDTTNAAVAALTAEELAQWNKVLADATEKNIAFATI